MFKLLLKKAGPIVPILYVDANINPARTGYLLRKLRKSKFYFA